MIIRKADSKDIENIAELYVSNWKATYSGLLADEYLNHLDTSYGADKWSSFLKHADHHIFVACDESRFFGFAACSPDPEIDNCMYIDSVHVSPDAQGKHIGTRLIQTIGEHAADRGYTKMSICIVRGNDRARGLYCKLGAVHYSYFVDNFGGTESQSEKLVWTDIKSML